MEYPDELPQDFISTPNRAMTAARAARRSMAGATGRIRTDAAPFVPLQHWPGPLVLFGHAAVVCWTGQHENGWYQADGSGDLPLPRSNCLPCSGLRSSLIA
jgi:hypothetical protein